MGANVFQPAWVWVSLGWFVHVALFLLVSLHSLRRRRESSATLLWVFAAWALPVLGPLAYLAFGVDRVPEKAFRKHVTNENLLRERRAREDAALPLAYWRAVHEAGRVEPATPFAREWDRAMQAIVPDYPLLGGNRLEPLVTGDALYPRMLDAIRGARRHVHLQCFMVRDDEVGRAFADALAARAREGVAVRLLYDRFGSTHAVLRGLFRRLRGVPNLRAAGWTQANPLKRQFQINLRNHRKAMIVDGRRAFLGGINLHAENTSRPEAPPIRDYHFAVEGPIVQEIQYAFMRDWYFMTDEDPERLLSADHFPHIEPAGGAMVRLITGGPTREVEAITDAFFLSFALARRQVLAVTPYFVPSRDILRAMRLAARRGVDVRLLVPKKNNHPYAGWAGRALYDELLDAGVRIFERRPPFLHGKALVVDDEFALVGTANFDARSLRLSYETNIAVHDAPFANRVKAVVLRDFACSDELDPVRWQNRPAGQRLIENLAYLMEPVL